MKPDSQRIRFAGLHVEEYREIDHDRVVIKNHTAP